MAGKGTKKFLYGNDIAVAPPNPAGLMPISRIVLNTLCEIRFLSDISVKETFQGQLLYHFL